MLIDEFQGKRILIVGDVMLDHFVRGSVSRVSPEAPTLVLNANHDYWAVGGAGNVARNVTALGGVACLVGLIGEDRAATKIAQLLADDPMLENRLVTDPSWPTIEKVRFIAGDNHLLRVDREIKTMPDGVGERVIAEVKAAVSDCACVIISDYAKGVVSTETIRAVIKAAQGVGVPVVADPKRPNFEDYRGAVAPGAGRCL